MEQLLENKTIWDKLKNNIPLEYDDFEKHVCTREYINAFNNNDYSFSGKEYNDNLNMYFFEVEEYDSEEDYREVFFQNSLDKIISKEYYMYHEDKFIKMMELLFNISETIVFYSFYVPLKNNHPAQKSKDVLKDLEKINSNSDKFVSIGDWELFKQICYISAREIEYVCYVFPDIKAILINSGMHGYIFSDEPLNEELKNSISNILRIHSVSEKLFSDNVK